MMRDSLLKIEGVSDEADFATNLIINYGVTLDELEIYNRNTNSEDGETYEPGTTFYFNGKTIFVEKNPLSPAMVKILIEFLSKAPH